MTILNGILQWDHYYYKLLSQDLTIPLVLLFFEFITNAGDVIIVLMLAYWLLSLIGGLSRDRHELVGRILVPVAITAAITLLLKAIIHRGAPASLFEPFFDISILPVKYVFPSGHTSRAFALAVAVGIAYPKWRIPLYAAAALIGFSRVYVGAHYPSDVIAGAMLGIAVSFIYQKASSRFTDDG